jgi:uncharacterized protein YdeI (BOF family)
MTAALAVVAWMAVPANATDPYMKLDGDWISLTGTVTETTLDGFQLDYGDGTILVEMDDWDLYDESNQLKNDDRVTVYGRIDDSFFETRSIEAGTVYDFDRSTYYYASSADEEGDSQYLSYVNVYPFYPEDGEWVQLSGTVKNIDDREFTLAMGLTDMTVDTDEMSYNPLDDEGYQQIDEGDRVSVWGHIDHDLFESRELKAETLVTLDDIPMMGS